MSASALNWARRELDLSNPTTLILKAALYPVHALMAVPALLYFAALMAMLMRPPNVEVFPFDRLLFGLLTVAVLARGMIQGQDILPRRRATLPMLGLTLMALFSAVQQPYDPEAWSLLAAKFIVPFTLFHLAQFVFRDEGRFRQFEVFALLVLAYLSFTSIAFLAGARSLIFPRFILDESLGHHADRARGPFLQAVANGVSLNMLGLLALHAYRRGTVRGAKVVVLLLSVPIAILATMTRAVWLSFAGTIVALFFLSRDPRTRRAGVGLLILAGTGLVAALSFGSFGRTLNERLEERSPVDYRMAVYTGGWRMFLQRPISGWGFHQMPAELPRFVSGYQEKELYPHNTYLELLVEHGVIGLALYLWLAWEVWQLGRGGIPRSEHYGFLSQDFHRMWPVLLAVYYLNAAVAVMSYQFVNGLLFTMAGMLAAQQQRAKASGPC